MKPLARYCLVLLLALPGIAIAQEQNAWSQQGTIQDVSATMVSIKTGADQVWLVRVDPKAKVQVEGTAEAGYLHAGLNVRFSGEIDKKGALQSDITQLEIFTPQDKRSIGLFPAGGGPDAKPVRVVAAGKYEIRARVNTYKDGQLTVSAGGKKITGKLAPNAEIKVNAASLQMAQEGDTIRASGWKIGPTQAMANDIAVTLTKPLASVVKKPRPTKPPRTPRNTPPPVSDPFGAGEGKGK